MGIQNKEKWKGIKFMHLDFGEHVVGGTGKEGCVPYTLPSGIRYYYNERKILHPTTNQDIRLCDNALIDISDNTKIDGSMQCEETIIHRKGEICEWLARAA